MDEADAQLDPEREIAPEQVNDMRYRIQTGQDPAEVAALYQVSVDNMTRAIEAADELTRQGANETLELAREVGERTEEAQAAIKRAIDILEGAD
jgi:hypothetical protein